MILRANTLKTLMKIPLWLTVDTKPSPNFPSINPFTFLNDLRGEDYKHSHFTHKETVVQLPKSYIYTSYNLLGGSGRTCGRCATSSELAEYPVHSPKHSTGHTADCYLPSRLRFLESRGFPSF